MKPKLPLSSQLPQGTTHGLARHLSAPPPQPRKLPGGAALFWTTAVLLACACTPPKKPGTKKPGTDPQKSGTDPQKSGTDPQRSGTDPRNRTQIHRVKPKGNTPHPVKIDVHGHRGARGRRPENTLSAFKFAIDSDVDYLEMDLQVTRDNRLVVSHDPVVHPKRCISPGDKSLTSPVPIRSLTFTELQRYDCGSLKNPNFPSQLRVPGEKIPSLEAVLRLAKSRKTPSGRTVGLNIETKIKPGLPNFSPKPRAFSRLLVQVLKRTGWKKRVVIQSFDYRTLRTARKMAPWLKLSLLTSGHTTRFVDILSKERAQILSPHHHWITADDVRRVHASGRKVIPWTSNEPGDWQRLVDMGVDGIITDYPRRLVRFLKGKRLR